MSEKKSLADLAVSCVSVDVCSWRPAESGTKNSGAAAAGRLRSRAQAANLDSPQNYEKDRPLRSRRLLLKGKT